MKSKKILCLLMAALLIGLSSCANPSTGEMEETEAPVVGGTVAGNSADTDGGRDTDATTDAITEATTDTETEAAKPEEWIDRESASFSEKEEGCTMVITGIGDGYFMARTFGAVEWRVKVIGALPDYMGVGYEAEVIYKNAYKDEETHRMECDLVDIFEIPVPEKPVIYLYPEKTTDVSVKLTMNGKLTCTYPAYRDGWQVTASPDGTLTDADGKVYNYLYWEGISYTEWDYSRGFCVRGEDTAAFLEDALEKLGLTRREANEFIVYWLPRMEQNPYNIIAFQTARYTESAKLEILPAPDTLIRVFMSYYASDSYVEMEPQVLTAPAREGFVAVEWGGAEG